jgi:hypothetical protein
MDVQSAKKMSGAQKNTNIIVITAGFSSIKRICMSAGDISRIWSRNILSEKSIEKNYERSISDKWKRMQLSDHEQ